MTSVPTVDPVVNVIIAVHSATRPIQRAVASVLEHTRAHVRAIVVAHNIDPAVIAKNLGAYAKHPDVQLIELQDGIPSPAGPMNAGFDAATAQFVCLLGSDDEFAPGAIDSWLSLQEATGAEAVLARITLPDGRSDPYPPVRMGRRTRRLDAVKDRLAYRSAPLGLIGRDAFGHLRLTAGLPSGEDLVFMLNISFAGHPLAYDLHHRGYIVNDDSTDRVTFEPRELSLDFAFLDVLEREQWFHALCRAGRDSIVLKIIRIHVFDAIASRVRTDESLARNRRALQDLTRRLMALAPRAQRLLSRADARVLTLLGDDSSTPSDILNAINDRHRLYSPATALPTWLPYTLHRQAPLRTLWTGFRIQNGALLTSVRGSYGRTRA